MESSLIVTALILTAFADATPCMSCTNPQTGHSAPRRTFPLGLDDLTELGLAFITPSSAVGQEE
jgi:hypothetical protein